MRWRAWSVLRNWRVVGRSGRGSATASELEALLPNAASSSPHQSASDDATRPLATALNAQQVVLVMHFDENGDCTTSKLNRLEVLGRIRRAQTTDAVLEQPRASSKQPHDFCDVQPVHMRDLRKLDASFGATSKPFILARQQAILFSADPLRAIVLRDSCMVLVPLGADGLHARIISSFKEFVQMKDASTAFEFMALEAILSTLTSYVVYYNSRRLLQEECNARSVEIVRALNKVVQGKGMSTALETLRIMKNGMSDFEAQVDSVRRALMELLDNEEDMRLLHLTKLFHNPQLLMHMSAFDAEDVEVMLESYSKDVFATHTKASLLQHRIQTTERLVTMKLDYSRNYLLSLDLIFSLIAIALELGTYLSGAMGMNLASNLPQTPAYFWGACALILSLSILVVVVGMQFLRRCGLLVLA
ncbi:TPA: hypothetical protein N0F65_002577 [Lagenidium giganteum]|uniref:Magnesium transporter n=1 Tax=Lagenidium giganteum TaxID=4803 RepID=A0AAV2YW32_9STRA|nr:TPA: hypothetical protein N0F65_002577 [Lagenidium giganteum]